MFPMRRRELNEYLNIIAGLAVTYGGTHFYNYHRLFSAKCAARVNLWNQCPYWGAIDMELHNRVFLGCRTVTCAVCSSPEHNSDHCSYIEGNTRRCSTAAAKSPSSVHKNPNETSTKSDQDSLNMDKVCFRFNASRCNLSSCRYLHVCNYCAGAHARPLCPVYASDKRK